MTPTLATFLYKIVCVGSGLTSIYFGYRLFVLGIFGASGDLEAELKDTRVVLTKAAPGTFFALFGAFVIATTVYKGIQFENGPASYTDPVATISTSAHDHPIPKILSALKTGTKLSPADYEAAAKYLLNSATRNIYIGSDDSNKFADGIADSRICHECHGTGSKDGGRCESCEGTGKKKHPSPA